MRRWKIIFTPGGAQQRMLVRIMQPETGIVLRLSVCEDRPLDECYQIIFEDAETEL